MGPSRRPPARRDPPAPGRTPHPAPARRPPPGALPPSPPKAPKTPQPPHATRPHPPLRRLPPRPRHGPPPREGAAKQLQPVAAILGENQASLLDIVDNVLNQGVLITGDLVLGLAGVDLVYVRLSALLCAADRVLPGADRRTPAKPAGTARTVAADALPLRRG